MDPRARYNEHNAPNQRPTLVPGLKERIFFGVSAFFVNMLTLYHHSSKDVEMTDESKGADHSKKKQKTDLAADEINLALYDSILAAGIYSLNAVKSFFKPFENINVDKIYSDAKEGMPTALTLMSGKTSIDNMERLSELVTLKAGKKETVNFGMFELKTTLCGSHFVYSLALNGAYVNSSRHMATINQVLTLMSLYGQRFKECWYQSAGVNKRKNVNRGDRADPTAFLSFESFGISRSYYHHLRMINLAREIKSKVRNMTGIGTDIIDYIEAVRGESKVQGETKKIEAAMKRKLMCWKNDNIIDDYLKYLEENKNDQSRLSSINSLFLGTVNMKMAAVSYKIVLPAYYYSTITKIEDIPDFSAQGAFKAYRKFQQTTVSKKVGYNLDESQENLSYAVIMSIFDLHQADQNIVKFYFANFLPKIRSDLKPKLEVGRRFQSIKLPQLTKFAKMYSGERGTGGREQASVVQTTAGKILYKGDDFIVDKPTEAVMMDRMVGSGMIIQRLQSELKAEYGKKRQKTISYGTQKWYDATLLDKTNEELAKEVGTDHQESTRVIPFYASRKEEVV